MPIEETVLNLIGGVYGYSALFLSLVLGIVGLPIPDEVIMTYVGFLVSQGRMSFSIALIVSFLGSVVGMSISYSLGRYFGLPLVFRYGKRLGIKRGHLDKVQRWYARFGPFVLTIGYFLPGIRHVTAFSAGMSRLSLVSFATYAYFGGFIWALTFISLGRMLGVHWEILFQYLHVYGPWLLASLIAGAAGAAYFRFRRRRRRP